LSYTYIFEEETGVPGENHWLTTSHWQTLIDKVVSSTPHHEWDSTLVVIATNCTYLLTLPLFTGVSRMDWVSCAGDINPPHTPFPPERPPPNTKIKYNKILTYILRSIFLEIPHLELPCWWKTPRDTNGKGV
jgi:hypothetical protein